jgi:hypothetical protein
MPSADVERQLRRADRHDRLKPAQRALSSSKSSRQCFYSGGGAAIVSVGRKLTAHVSGVNRCGSAWSCPTCAPVVRQRKAQEIEEGVGRHLAAGGGAELLSGTLPHRQGDELGPRLALVAEAMRQLLKGSGWDRRRRRLGYVGLIRALEVTIGLNGWHPHVHVLVLFDRPLTPEERKDLRAWLLARWTAIVAAAGFGKLHQTYGLDLRQVDGVGALGDYLTKVEGKADGWGIGNELARADLKRGGRGMVPFELLADFVATGDITLARLWQEFERATFGHHSVRWSAGLKARLGVVEVSDEEAAASEGADDAYYFRWLIEAAVWRARIRSRSIGQLLTDCELIAAQRFAAAAALGVELRQLDPGDMTDGSPP